MQSRPVRGRRESMLFQILRSISCLNLLPSGSTIIPNKRYKRNIHIQKSRLGKNTPNESKEPMILTLNLTSFPSNQGKTGEA